MIAKKAWEGASEEVALQASLLPQAPHTHSRAATAQQAPPWMMGGAGALDANGKKQWLGQGGFQNRAWAHRREEQRLQESQESRMMILGASNKQSQQSS